MGADEFGERVAWMAELIIGLSLAAACLSVLMLIIMITR